ncbi:hypothetical protein [Nonomuraea sp. B5E05]
MKDTRLAFGDLFRTLMAASHCAAADTDLPYIHAEGASPSRAAV